MLAKIRKRVYFILYSGGHIVKCINNIPPKLQTKIRVDFNHLQWPLEICNPRITQRRFPFIGFIILKTSNFSSRFQHKNWYKEICTGLRHIGQTVQTPTGLVAKSWYPRIPDIFGRKSIYFQIVVINLSIIGIKRIQWC